MSWINYVSAINADFEKSDFKSIYNEHVEWSLFVIGLRNACYTDVRARILTLTDEKQEMSVQ